LENGLTQMCMGSPTPDYQYSLCNTVFPIQEAVAMQVEARAIKDKQPLIQATGLVFEWAKHF